MRPFALSLLLLPAQAWASGYYFSDSGVEAASRGGAWVAGADAQFAQRYNPAGLMRVDRPTFNLGLSGVTQKVTFERRDLDGTTYDPATNGAPPFAVPQIGFATPLGEKFALGVGLYSPFAPSVDYAADGAQRYSVINTFIWEFRVGPSLAWRPIPQLTVGMGLQWGVLRIEESLKAQVAFTEGQLGNPDNDVLVTANVVDKFTPSANFGLLVEPVPQVSIGLGVQPPISYQARGPATLDFTGNALEEFLDQAVWTDEDVALNLRLPLEVRAGVAVRPMAKLEIEGNFVWTDWSVVEEILVEDIQLTVTGSLPDTQVPETLALPAGLRDAWSARLGAEWREQDAWAVRAGAMFETGAVPQQKLSVALVDMPKAQVGGGGSLWFKDGRVRVDGTFAYLALQKQEINNSEVTLVNAANEDLTMVVGNGTLKSSGWVAGTQVSLALGERREGHAWRPE
jgi:long-chain fatty acid transport protein